MASTLSVQSLCRKLAVTPGSFNFEAITFLFASSCRPTLGAARRALRQMSVYCRVQPSQRYAPSFGDSPWHLASTTRGATQRNSARVGIGNLLPLAERRPAVPLLQSALLMQSYSLTRERMPNIHTPGEDFVQPSAGLTAAQAEQPAS